MADHVTSHTDVIVIGSGISGLTAAYALLKHGYRVVVLEKGGQSGGLIQSVRDEGYLLEMGPHTFPNTASNLLALCRECGLNPVTASTLAKNRYIFHQNRLIALPHTPWGILGTPLLSFGGKYRLFSEPFRQKATPLQEETVAQFVRRRLGPEVLDRLVGPFLSGVYAGDPDLLSVQSVFPKWVSWETSSGSLLKGWFDERRKQRKSKYTSSSFNHSTPYTLLSLADGVGGLSDALSKTLPEGTLRLRQVVDRVILSHETRHNDPVDHYTCYTTTGDRWESRAMVLATPAWETARLIPLGHDIKRCLEGIPYVPMAVVHLGFSENRIPHPLDGFGCLIPRTTGLKTLGIIWSSSLFPDRAPKGHILMSAFIGGTFFPEICYWDEVSILQTVLREMKTVFCMPKEGSPSFCRIIRWSHAIPQYEQGHQGRINAITQALPHTLALAGNYLNGVSLNACVQSGQQAAEKILATLEGNRKINRLNSTSS